jgi:hypothetical protein
MFSENSNYSKPVQVIYATLFLVFTVIILSRISDLSYVLSRMFNHGLNSRGGIYEAIAMLSAPLVLLFWLWLIFGKKEYLNALVFQILLFPFTHKANAAFAINAYTNQSGYTQKLSLTTMMIIFLFVVMQYRGKIIRPINPSWRKFEKILLFYGLLLTLTQLVNHTAFSSIALTIGGAWQYIMLFYILSSLLKTKVDFINILNGLLAFTVFNIIFRIFSEDQALVRSISSEMIRVGSGAMGPAVSYGGYLAVMITISLLLYRLKNNMIYLLAGALIFTEMLSTFTRGSSLSLIFLALLLFSKQERVHLYKHVLLIIPLLILLGRTIWEYIVLRGSPFSLEMINLDNVQVRIEIFQRYFTKVFDFSLVGNGIGNFTLVSNSITSPLVPHNIIISIIDQAGLIVVTAFVLLIGYSLKTSFKIVKSAEGRTYNTYSVYIMIALTQWLFFANTTSTLLNWYYPYEASAIFWMLLFIPVIISNVEEHAAHY